MDHGFAIPLANKANDIFDTLDFGQWSYITPSPKEIPEIKGSRNSWSDLVLPIWFGPILFCYQIKSDLKRGKCRRMTWPFLFVQLARVITGDSNRQNKTNIDTTWSSVNTNANTNTHANTNPKFFDQWWQQRLLECAMIWLYLQLKSENCIEMAQTMSRLVM